MRNASFDELVTEAEAAPVDGWGFAWLDGRATEERPPWGYVGVIGRRMAGVAAALDLQTGGGEVLAEIAPRPTLLVATESWAPNLAIARRRLPTVVAAGNAGPLPFRDDSVPLVVSRHPVVTPWGDIARVLVPGGTFLSQQIGAGSNRELTDALMGPQPVSADRSPARAVAAAEAVGLTVVDLREATLRVEFRDVGAVVWFLRKVVWTVPDFAVDRYRGPLRDLHDRMLSDGPFVCHAQRFLIEARKPGRRAPEPASPQRPSWSGDCRAGSGG
jgi:SAM-dependent methyltransferase